MPKTPNTPSVVTYSFNGMDLRVVEIDGEPWFHATDAGRLLGLQVDAGMVRHLGTLNPDEMRKENKATLNLIEGWAQKAWLISESGRALALVEAMPHTVGRQT